MLDFTKLWDKTYLLGPNPIELSRSDWLFFWASAVFVIAGIAAKLLASRQEHGSPRRFLFNRLFHACLTAGLLILLWTGTRFENVPWLSTHVTVLVLFLGWALWLGFIVWYLLRKFGREQKLWQEQALKRKYLNQK